MAILPSRESFYYPTDSHSLKYFLEGRTHTPFQQKWVTKLLGFDYEIQYKKGCENQATYALSRVSPDIVSSQTIGSISAISYPYSGLMIGILRKILVLLLNLSTYYNLSVMMLLLVPCDFI